MKRFNNNLYTKEIIVLKDGTLQYVENDDRTLFSGKRKTSILPEDLPEWYVYGRYYKRWGYLSTKGIVDILYICDKHFNHFLKDDCILISYKEEIKEKDAFDKTLSGLAIDKYEGYDEVVWGSDILDVLKGARDYSSYDISDITEQIKNKQKWLMRNYKETITSPNQLINIDDYFKT